MRRQIDHKAIRLELNLKDARLRRKKSKKPKKQVRNNNLILKQANAYSFKT